MSGRQKPTQTKPKQIRQKVLARQRTTAAQALQIAKEHLLNGVTFEVCDSRKTPLNFYATEHDCWLIFPTTGKCAAVGTSRVIAISKKTGKVVFDGGAGE